VSNFIQTLCVLMNLLLLLSLCFFASARGLNLRGICGWPVLYGGSASLNPPTPTSMAQGLLLRFLKLDFQVGGVDGKWGPTTTAHLEAFQKAVGLPTSTTMGSASWPKLAHAVAPITRQQHQTQPSAAVAGVQVALRAYQQNIHIMDPPGIFGSSTAQALVSFSSSHGLPLNNGNVIDAAHLQLLATNCNGSMSTDAFWFDAGKT
jgi:hypothetical protein